MGVVLHGAFALPGTIARDTPQDALFSTFFRIVKVDGLAGANHPPPVRDEEPAQKRSSTETMKAPQIRQLLRRSEQGG
jgi:hypothetical protein